MNIGKMIKVIHLQPFIPHYREEFFSLLGRRLKEKNVGQSFEQEIYTFEKTKDVKSASFNMSNISCKHIQSMLIKGKLLVYNPFKLLRKEDEVLVLMLHFAHITTWLLLLTKWIHHKKIILWGQGISVKRYLKEEKKPDWKLRLMISLSDGVWFYMDKEMVQWQKLFPRKPMIALRNTLSGVNAMTQYVPEQSVSQLKQKYGIKEDVVLVFCARFTATRRVDLLLETIKRLNPDVFGFIIIGDGAYKPDFSEYHNVHDFGQLYDTSVKRELFAIADIYFQPGWVGLSIVEAMAYGKPIFTFKRSNETLQCVEYSYIRDRVNGRIFTDVEECVSCIEKITKNEIHSLGKNARDYVKNNITIQQMVNNGMNVINAVVGKIV